MKIPEEAVEAAATIVRHITGARDTSTSAARLILEAAAPFLAAAPKEAHFGCPDCGEQSGCDCRWKDSV